MNIVVLPLWLRKTLDSEGCDYRDALSLKKLATILSLDDVAFYRYLNSNILNYIDELPLKDLKVDENVQDLTPLIEPDVEDDLSDKIMRAYDYLYMRPKVSKVAALIGVKESLVEEEIRIGYNVKLVSETTLAILPYILDEDADSNKASLNFASEVVRNQLILQPLEEVAKQQHFAGYIGMLS